MDLRCISADSHIVEPPHCYADFIEPKYRDVAPRVVRHADGYDTYWVRDLPRTTTVGLLASAGLKDHAKQDFIAHATFDQLPAAAGTRRRASRRSSATASMRR